MVLEDGTSSQLIRFFKMAFARFLFEPPLVALASTVGAKEKRLSQASSFVGSVIMRFNIFDKAAAHALLAAFGILVINGIQGECLNVPVTSSAEIDGLGLSDVFASGAFVPILGPLV